MKKRNQLRVPQTRLLVILLLLFTTGVQAQSARTPRYVSAKGYWVVETLNNREPQRVYYYNNDGILTGTGQLDGRVRTTRTRVRMQLKRSLESSIDLYAVREAARQDLQTANAKN